MIDCSNDKYGLTEISQKKKVNPTVVAARPGGSSGLPPKSIDLYLSAKISTALKVTL